jgi:hypothetical protein
MTIADLVLEVQNLLDSYNLGMTTGGLLALSTFIVAALLYLIARTRITAAYHLTLRPLPAYDQIKQAITEATESGDVVHLSTGAGSVGAASTTETLAGINAVAAAAGRAATSHAASVITTASPVVLPLVQGAAERAYASAGAPGDFDPAQVRFTADERNAYAVAAADVVSHERVSASLIIGALADETLLIGERGRQAAAEQMIGAADVRALPYAMLTANWTIVGEEIYAAGAYLAGWPAHLASLLAQDWLRLIVVAVIVAGVVIRTMG